MPKDDPVPRMVAGRPAGDNADPEPKQYEIGSFLPPRWLEEVDSTSLELTRRLEAGESLPSGYVLAAHRQTCGKGRMGARWHTPEAGDLTFSFICSPEAAYPAIGAVPLACGLGVRDYLCGLGIAALCKWPNDIMVGEAKLGGILTEGGIRAGGTATLVVGVGINLRHLEARDGELGRKTTSLESLAGRRFLPEEELPAVLAGIRTRLWQWRECGHKAIAKEMGRYLWGRDKRFTARTREGVTEGVIAGLGENGELLLRKNDGVVISVASVGAVEEIRAGI